jgi:integrase
MPITRAPDGRYEVAVCVRRVRLHRRLPAGASASDAKRVEAELRLAAARQAEQPALKATVPGDPMLPEVMALYVIAAQRLRSPDTAVHHAQRIGQWTERYRASQARQCAAHILRDMHGSYAPATINRSIGTLKRALRLGWEQGLCAEDWGVQIHRQPEHNAREVYLSLDQIAHLASHASEAVRAAIWIALYTGCRRGEVVAIKAEDIGADSITIHAGNTKTLRTRTVPIIPALRPWLAHLPLAVNAEGLKSGFRRAREAAGMPHVHYHDLRHSCATILLAQGVDLYTISRILGHSTIRMTERYSHLQIDQQRAALERAFGCK